MNDNVIHLQSHRMSEVPKQHDGAEHVKAQTAPMKQKSCSGILAVPSD
jgi:hypothetical protein